MPEAGAPHESDATESAGDSAPPRWRWLVRPTAVFVAMFAVLAVMAGPDLLAKSPAPHYAYTADAWLHGRVSLAGDPPGYPRAHDDWARVSTIELSDGTSFRGYPCVTDHCTTLRRDALTDRGRASTWMVLGEDDPRVVARRDIVSRTETWYVSFPPGPAVFMLPLVALLGLVAPEGLLAALAAALAPALLVAWLDRRRGRAAEVGLGNLFAAVALGLATPLVVLGAHGRVWFTAQVLGALWLLIYATASDRVERPTLAGLALGLAVSCRPHLLLAAVLFGAHWWRDGRDARKAIAFVVPLATIGVLLAAYNYARFESIFEFGHRFLDIRWQTRMQSTGQFSLAYLPRNLRCAFTLLPQLQGSWPFVKVSIHGMALWLASPWLAGAGWALWERFGNTERRAAPASATAPTWPLWVSCALIAAVPLLYHNSGQLQFSYRFALDWLPLAAIALASGGVFERRWVQALVLVGVAVNLHGAWYFDRAPRTLFVTDPLGWPFEGELRRG